MRRSATYDALLGPNEPVVGHPFADPACTRSDAAVMSTMLRRQRAIARAWGRQCGAAAAVRQGGENGRREWLAVPDTAALLAACDVTAIGFFGQARETDHTVLFELEEEVADSFSTYAKVGLLSYYDLELEEDSYGFGNLILFWTPDVPREWYANAAHARAVAISPEYYRSIRLHKGWIPGPFLGTGELTIERTKYFDFDSDPVWLGLRTFVADE